MSCVPGEVIDMIPWWAGALMLMAGAVAGILIAAMIEAGGGDD